MASRTKVTRFAISNPSQESPCVSPRPNSGNTRGQLTIADYGSRRQDSPISVDFTTAPWSCVGGGPRVLSGCCRLLSPIHTRYISVLCCSLSLPLAMAVFRVHAAGTDANLRASSSWRIAVWPGEVQQRPAYGGCGVGWGSRTRWTTWASYRFLEYEDKTTTL